MNHKSLLSWRSLIFFTLAILLPGIVSAQTNYYWQTIAANVAANPGPLGIGVDIQGDVFFADPFDDIIFKATSSGTNWTIVPVAGTSGSANFKDGTNSGALFDQPVALVVQNSSTLYVADTLNSAIRQVQLIGTNWVVTTIAGGTQGSMDGTNLTAQFDSPYGVAMDAQGNLYVADENNSIIRKIHQSGTNWITTTIAGTPGNGNWSDGTNGDAGFEAPAGITVNAAGDLFVVDYNDSTVREITPIGTNWVTVTIAGQPGNFNFSDGTNTASVFNSPTGVAVDSMNNVFVADYFNNAIRKVSPAGGTNWVTRTIGGSGSNGGSPIDGTNVMAQFNSPQGIAVDFSGNVYVGDTDNNALRVGYLFPPSLNLVLAGNQATLSYPASLGTNFGFIVQAATNLSNPVWLNVTNRWLLTTNSIPFNIFGMTNKVPNRYFRLQLP